MKQRALTEAWWEYSAPERRLHITSLPAGEEERHRGGKKWEVRGGGGGVGGA